MDSIHKLLEQMDGGNPNAADRLIGTVYQDLRRLASQKLANEAPGQTLQPTALVHEVWLRLSGSCEQPWRGREHFFGAAAEAMRRILVENARRKSRIRHGGDLQRVDSTEIDLPIARDDDKCLEVNEALEE